MNNFIFITLLLAVLSMIVRSQREGRHFPCRGNLNRHNTTVCGWYNPRMIQCFRYPCARPFNSAREACSTRNVSYYTLGPCPA